jgi:hypothetical protein
MIIITLAHLSKLEPKFNFGSHHAKFSIHSWYSNRKEWLTIILYQFIGKPALHERRHWRLFFFF